MRPILIFAIAAIAASAIGVGALNNNILLTVQQFGVGSQDIESPIDAAKIDFEMDLVPVFANPGSPLIPGEDCTGLNENPGPPPDGNCTITPDTPAVPASDPIFKNLITGCSFHSDENILSSDDGPAIAENDPVLICKLTDIDHRIVAEGKLSLPNGYEHSATDVIIPITQLAFPGANDFTNIKDVHLVVFGTDPTQPPFEITPTP
jgi:hypothetical protein